MDEKFLTTATAAGVLQRCSEMVRTYERKGLLPAIKTESGMRLDRLVDVQELRKKLEKRRASTL